LNPDSVATYSINDIIGTSKEILEAKKITQRSAKTDSTILITGESGTGKEVFANAIHNLSSRRLAKFVKINCAAIPSELLESELFGYDEGAFTGARKGGKIGKFQLANGGSILLDEIGDMSLHMQAKLLRVIQEKEVEKVGSLTSESVDVRIIASTNRDLEEMVKSGEFREDLYYRLNVIRVELPPLRDRRDDIEALSGVLRKKIAERLGVYVEGISKQSIKYLSNYDFPGNIRELENIIERSINMLDGDLIIEPAHLPTRITKEFVKKRYTSATCMKSAIEEIEKDMIITTLKKTDNNKNETAKLLGISRPSLYKKIGLYGIEI
jgi:transcriptional regulator with PAS, ATPase and Fis domain